MKAVAGQSQSQRTYTKETNTKSSFLFHFFVFCMLTNHQCCNCCYTCCETILHGRLSDHPAVGAWYMHIQQSDMLCVAVRRKCEETHLRTILSTEKVCPFLLPCNTTRANLLSSWITSSFVIPLPLPPCMQTNFACMVLG